MINFRGRVTSGLKKAGKFMQMDIYQNQYLDKLGFKPYNGTLNVKLNNEYDINLKDKFNDKLKIIEGNESYGDVYFLDAIICSEDKKISKKGAILFPTKTIHKIDTVEFVAEDNLREKLELDDDSKVIISIK